MDYIRFHQQLDFIGISGVITYSLMECPQTIYNTQIDQIYILQQLFYLCNISVKYFKF